MCNIFAVCMIIKIVEVVGYLLYKKEYDESPSDKYNV